MHMGVGALHMWVGALQGRHSSAGPAWLAALSGGAPPPPATAKLTPHLLPLRRRHCCLPACPACRWVWELRQNVQNPNLIIALVGNKVDLADEARQVPEADARAYAGGCSDVLCAAAWLIKLQVQQHLLRGPCPTCSPRCPCCWLPLLLPSIAAETGLVYFETSAKANINVVQLFDEVADK